MPTEIETGFIRLENEILPKAKAIIYNGCHKIYIAMDDEDVQTYRDLGYGVPEGDGSHLLTIGATDTQLALLTVRTWFYTSCPMRFIYATDNAGNYDKVIPQGADEDEDDIMEIDLMSGLA